MSKKPCFLDYVSFGPLVVVVAMLFTLGLIATAGADEFTPALKRVLQKAKQEGTVRFFVGSPHFPQSASVELSKAFQKEFGFPIKVVIASLGAHPPVVNKIVQETKMGIPPAADLFPTGERLLQVLRKAHAVAPTDWAALGVPKDKIDPPGDGVFMRVNPRNVVYNTNLVKAADAPHSYQDLLNPKWKGKIVAPAFGAAFGGLALVMGEQNAYRFVRKLVHDQKMVLVPTFTEMTTKVVNGEFALGYGLNANALGYIDKGAPIANAPLKKVWGSSNYAVVLKHAANQAAARAFGYFICCTEIGRKAIYRATKIGTFDEPGTELYEIGGNGKGVLPSFKFPTQEEARIDKKMAKILGF